MTALEWVLISSLLLIYLTLLFTAAVLTFRRGHLVLFAVGFFFPILWLVGIMVPPKDGHAYGPNTRF